MRLRSMHIQADNRVNSRILRVKCKIEFLNPKVLIFYVFSINALAVKEKLRELLLYICNSYIFSYF